MQTISEKEFTSLADYIKQNYGINLKKEKQTLLIGRLNNVLMQNGFDSFAEYYEHVVSDRSGDAAITLVDRITTNHTFFMREADHFTFFAKVVLPYLDESVRTRDLRIWSAGCSTGEEPYTLAMILDEFLGKEKILWDAKILATDISGKVLDTAARGEYAGDRLSSVPPAWRLNYFRKLGNDRYIISDRLRNEVIFRKFNLMDTVYPFKRKFHVIFCRNVMIYFDEATKKELVEKFYESMEKGGYLFIGHSESLNRDETKFRYVMPAIYRKE